MYKMVMIIASFYIKSLYSTHKLIISKYINLVMNLCTHCLYNGAIVVTASSTSIDWLSDNLEISFSNSASLSCRIFTFFSSSCFSLLSLSNKSVRCDEPLVSSCCVRRSVSSSACSCENCSFKRRRSLSSTADSKDALMCSSLIVPELPEPVCTVGDFKQIFNQILTFLINVRLNVYQINTISIAKKWCLVFAKILGFLIREYGIFFSRLAKNNLTLFEIKKKN